MMSKVQMSVTVSQMELHKSYRVVVRLLSRLVEPARAPGRMRRDPAPTEFRARANKAAVRLDHQ